MLQFLLPLLLLSGLLHISSATQITLLNKCDFKIWPGILPNAGSKAISGGGLVLNVGESKTLVFPAYWSGRMWGRLGCSFDRNGRGGCLSGDCGGVFCCQKSGETPATLVEFNLGKLDFYDISLVDGYNVKMSFVPHNNSCKHAGCLGDVNSVCPVELREYFPLSKKVMACRSACSKFGSPRYCCTERFQNPNCYPSSYSEIFKKECPHAYSYAYDDRSSLFTCVSGGYSLIFC